MKQTAPHRNANQYQGLEMKTANSNKITQLEIKTVLLIQSQNYILVESKFRATDRNLTIRLRNHENKRP
ncbi:hypothetical protein [uncultured Desulfobulbus sp.]|uniref:hypothetical protein n=1 Tax=uncultured Desulfobulbus sp. TaxID=239745 RepID=UPI0029C9A088|nr:hypothetical protein [uncultured Desulfobulbus sp.]